MLDPSYQMIGFVSTLAVLLYEESAGKHWEIGEVAQHDAERPDTTPNNDETDTVPCLPFASRSIAMGAAAITSPEATQMPRHWPPKRTGCERSPSYARKRDMMELFLHKIVT